MTQSVELLLDAQADAVVRADWTALLDVGLPSQASNTAATNRPHVTLWAGAALSGATDDALGALVPGVPMPLRLGAIACFGRHRFILVRLVVASVPLLRLQASVADMCGFEAGSTLAPGHWTPHVTLARRLTATQVGAALDVLRGPRERERDAYAVGWRRWDGDARREWALPVRSLQ